MVQGIDDGNDSYSEEPAGGSGEVVVYGSSPETDPLIENQTKRSKTWSPACRVVLWVLSVLALAAFVMTGITTGVHLSSCPLDSTTRDTIRLGWEAETHQHDEANREWERKSDEQVKKEQEWKNATEQHALEVARRECEERKRQTAVRQEWVLETQHHTREVEKREHEECERQDAMRREWVFETEHQALEVEKRNREERARQDDVRREWAREVEKREHEERERQDAARREWVLETKHHALEVETREREERERQDAVRREWDREAEGHARKVEEALKRERERRELELARWRRELAERDRLEDEERQKRHMFWGDVEVHGCTTYATRSYAARLMNLPWDWRHPLAACQATPLEIHGVLRLPMSCEDRGPGIVIGRWEISDQEPDCRTFWAEFNDKGCTSPGSGKKYITQKLMNLPGSGNWKEFCATTPTSFNNMYFPAAQECFTSIWGVYGQWEIEDGRC